MLQNKPIFPEKHHCHPGPHVPPPPHICHPHPDYCHDNIIINPYNKVCFKDKVEAEQMLLNKDLHAGETAYAYYYDNDVAYGINAIQAVGNIKVGAPNILFENSDDITKHIEILHKLLKEHDTLIEDIKNTADKALHIDELIERLDTFEEDTNESIIAVQDDINDVREITTELSEHLSFIDSSIEELRNTDFLLETTLNDKIEKLNESIKNIDSSISDITGDNEDSHNALDEFKLEFNAYVEQHANEVEQNNTSIVNAYTALVIDTSRSLVDLMNEKISDLHGEGTYWVNEFQVQVNSLKSQISDFNVSNEEKFDNILSEGQAYIDGKVSELTTLATAEFNAVSNRITDVEKRFDDLNHKLDASIKDISNNLDDAIKTHVNDVTKQYNILLGECTKYQTQINDTLAGAQSAITNQIGALNSKIETKYNELKTLFDSSLSTVQSSLDARITTVKTKLRSELNTSYIELSDIITKKVREVSNEIDMKIDKKVDVLDTRYEMKDSVRPLHVADDGGIKCETGHISLDIDAYGVLTFRGRKYQLQPVLA